MSTWMVMPSNDDVVHKYHKYIDRVRGKNGKWRYIYAKAKVNSVVGINKKKVLDQANKDLKYAKSNKNLHEIILGKIRKDNWNKTENGKAMEENWMESNSAAIDKLKKAEKNQKNAQEAFNKTLLGKISQVKDAGLKAWNNLFKGKGSFDESITVTNRGITYKYPNAFNFTSNSKIKSQYSPTKNSKSTKRTVTNKSGAYQYSPGAYSKTSYFNNDFGGEFQWNEREKVYKKKTGRNKIN